MRSFKNFWKLTTILSAVLFVTACGTKTKVNSQSGAATPLTQPSLFALLRPVQMRAIASGGTEVEFSIDASGATRFRFTPNGLSAVEFQSTASYKKNYAAGATEITETGLLEAYDASGSLLSSMTLQTGPHLVDTTNPLPSPTPTPTPPATPIAPVCVLTLSPNQATVAPGAVALVNAQINLVPNGATVTEAYIGSIKLNPGVLSASILLPQGKHTVLGKLVGPGGTGTCLSNTIDIMGIAPTCELKASATKVLFPGTKIELKATHLNPLESGPITELWIDGELTTAANKYAYPKRDTTYVAKIKNGNGESTCAVKVKVGIF